MGFVEGRPIVRFRRRVRGEGKSGGWRGECFIGSGGDGRPFLPSQCQIKWGYLL